MIKAWLFTGPKGTGKTSLSRILALSYQCKHQSVFGKPCLACRREKAKYPIYEANSADKTGIDAMRDFLVGAEYGVLGEGSFRVYIIDECHQLSKSAQNLLLKYLEDSPQTAIFILCSTAPQQIIETLRSRCTTYELKELDTDQTLILVNRLLEKVGSELGGDRLTDALAEAGIRSPRLITQAVEKYLTGATPEESAQVEGSTSVDLRALTRSVIKGNWPAVAKYLMNAEGLDIRAARLGILAYLRAVLLESSDISDRTKTVAEAITELCLIQNMEDAAMFSGVSAVLYKLTAMFSNYKL